MNRDQVQQQLREVFRRYLGVSSTVSKGLVPETVTAGKLYEAHVLSRVVEHLARDEGYSLTLVGGKEIQLKSSPGPINRKFPRIELHRQGHTLAELWTDVEFLSMSYCRGGRSPITRGDYHELDILIVDVEATGRPTCDEVWLGIECKNTGYEKGLLKEILGIRRELSLLSDPQQTRFRVWPRTTVPASPASCLMVYATDANVAHYSAPGTMFGIDFVHEAM